MHRKETIVKRCDVIVGAGLYAVALSAAALSLGDSRGTVILGSPIDLSFEIQPDEGTDLASSCVSAELRSGDVPISSARVRVVPLPDMPGRSPAVRVQAFVVADEPVFTATVSAGCSGRVSRTYTFLAQLPETVTNTAVPLDISRLSTVPSATGPSTGSTPSADRPVAQAAAPRVRQAPAAGAADAPRAPKPPPAPRKVPVRVAPTPAVAKAAPSVNKAAEARPPAAPASQPAPRSRLVMEPLDAVTPTPAALRPAPELAAIPAQTPASDRADAAATWKALNTDPKDAATQDQERVRELEAQVTTMKAQVAKERSGVTDLRQRLESIEADRYPSTVVYLLALALALVSGLMAWMWMRMQRDHAKVEQAWRDSVALMTAHEKEVAEHALVPHPRDTWSGEYTTLPAAEPTVPNPMVRAPVVEPVSAPVVAPAPTPALAPVQQPAAPVAKAAQVVHIVNPEELFDILQQAEFFVSVGEHDQAIGVLKKHIADRGETSPFAYLELLRLYHQLGRADDFGQLRTQFLRHFNAELPPFSRFRQQGRGLEHYTDALAEIEAQWTSPSVLALLEGYLFHQEGQPASVPPFDLAAYDDLLLLLAIVQTTPASARGAAPPRQRTTPLAPPAVPAPAASEPVPGGQRAEAWEQVSTERPPTLTDLSLDSLIGDLEFAPSSTPELAERPLSEAMLDIDLTEPPPPITISDLPAVPATAPPALGQPVGFGLSNDRQELRFELEQRPQPKDKG